MNNQLPGARVTAVPPSLEESTCPSAREGGSPLFFLARAPVHRNPDSLFVRQEALRRRRRLRARRARREEQGAGERAREEQRSHLVGGEAVASR